MRVGDVIRHLLDTSFALPLAICNLSSDFHMEVMRVVKCSSSGPFGDSYKESRSPETLQELELKLLVRRVAI